jgi:lysine-specific demethylase 8
MRYPAFRTRDRQLHNALWLADHLLGANTVDAVAGDVRRRVDARLAQALRPHAGGLEPVPEGDASDPAAFVRDHVEADVPVVFRGAARDWPAMRWTPRLFAERHGDEEVRLLDMAPDEIADRNYVPRVTTLADALAHLDAGNRAYCRFLPTLMDDPELRGDLDIDWFRARLGDHLPQENLQLFIGGAGTDTATHAALSANLFVQTHGRKRWRIYPASWSPVLRPPVDRTVYFMSGYDPDQPDHQDWPSARYLRGYEVELEPGDILYNPPFWWHKVSNPTVSIGAAYRWLPHRACWRSSRIMTLLTVLATDPPVWRARQVGLDFTKLFTSRR